MASNLIYMRKFMTLPKVCPLTHLYKKHQLPQDEGLTRLNDQIVTTLSK